LRCKNITIFSARIDWTVDAAVSQYEVVSRCSRTGNKKVLPVDGTCHGSSGDCTLLLESLEFDCIYDITVNTEEYHDYSLKCIIHTAGKSVYTAVQCVLVTSQCDYGILLLHETNCSCCLHYIVMIVCELLMCKLTFI